MDLATRRSQWAEVIVQWQAQGGEQTQSEFCQARGISLWKFRYWLGRQTRAVKSEAQVKAGFAEVALLPAQGSGIQLRVNERATFVLDPGFDVPTLRRILECLGATPC